MLKTAYQDFYEGFMQMRLSRALARQDIRLRYRRSTLGPFWITLSMAISILAMGPLYGTLFGNDVKEFLPHLALGMIFWAFISSSLLESSDVFNESEHMLKQAYLPLSVLLFRVCFRQCIALLHNLILYPFIILWAGVRLNWYALYVIPAFLLVTICLFALGIILSIFCTRFRDMRVVVQSVTTLCFFITPVIWQLPQLPESRRHLAQLNPFTSLISLLRDPLLGRAPELVNWQIAGSFAIVASVVAILLFGHVRKRITYWL